MALFSRLWNWLRAWWPATPRRRVRDEATASGRVRLRAYNAAAVEYRIPEWDALPHEAQVSELRRLDPIAEVVEPNTTCVGLDELRVDNLDENQSVDAKAVELAVGTDNTTPAHSNTSLNNEVHRTDVASTEDQGSSLLTTSVLSTNEANGNSLVECGLFSSDDRLLNHSTFASVSKTSSIKVTIEVTLSFSNA